MGLGGGGGGGGGGGACIAAQLKHEPRTLHYATEKRQLPSVQVSRLHHYFSSLL